MGNSVKRRDCENSRLGVAMDLRRRIFGGGSKLLNGVFLCALLLGGGGYAASADIDIGPDEVVYTSSFDPYGDNSFHINGGTLSYDGYDSSSGGALPIKIDINGGTLQIFDQVMDDEDYWRQISSPRIDGDLAIQGDSRIISVYYGDGDSDTSLSCDNFIASPNSVVDFGFRGHEYGLLQIDVSDSFISDGTLNLADKMRLGIAAGQDGEQSAVFNGDVNGGHLCVANNVDSTTINATVDAEGEFHGNLIIGENGTFIENGSSGFYGTTVNYGAVKSNDGADEEENFYLAGDYINAAGGSTNFTRTVTVANGASIRNLDAENRAVFNGLYLLDGSLIEGQDGDRGAFEINRTLDINGDSTATLYSEGSLGSVSFVTVGNGGTLNATADVINGGGGVYTFEGGTLTIGNYDAALNSNNNNNSSSILPYYVTDADYDVSTDDKWSELSKTIENNAENDVNAIGNVLTSSGGLLRIQAAYDETSDENSTPSTTYAVVMTDAEGQYGSKMSYYGDTDVALGAMVLKTDYSSSPEGNGTFVVRAESKGAISNESYDENGNLAGYDVSSVGTGGALAFWGEDGNAPTLYADRVVFEGAGTDKGAKLYLRADNKWDDTSSDRTVARIVANQVDFDSSNTVWYGGASRLDDGTKIKVSLGDPDFLSSVNATVDGALINEANADKLADLFSTDLIKASALFEDGQIIISSEVSDVERYVEENGMSDNAKSWARSIDSARKMFPAYDEFEALYNTRGLNIENALEDSASLGYIVPIWNGHYGNPTSNFFPMAIFEYGNARSGLQRRGQSNHERLEGAEGGEGLGSAPQSSALNNSWYDEGTSDLSKMAWASYVYSAIDGDEYKTGSDGRQVGYRMRRQGIIGGLRRELDGTTSGGLFFGITKPISRSGADFLTLDSDGNSYGDFNTKMKMNDFQFALHLEKSLCDTIELAAFVGGGAQTVDWEREVNLKSRGAFKHVASGTGNTLTGTLYLAQRIDLNDRWTFRPTIGVDSEHSWIYMLNEKEAWSNGVTRANNALGTVTDLYTIRSTYYNRNTGRVGATLSAQGAQGLAGISGRVFYGRQLGGKDSPYVSLDLLNPETGEVRSIKDLKTHAAGGDSLSVGAGGFMHFNELKTFTVSGEVNSVWYKNAKTLNMTGGFLYRF